MFINKRKYKILFVIFSMFFLYSMNIYAVWYNGPSGSNVQSANDDGKTKTTTTTGDSSNSSSSNNSTTTTSTSTTSTSTSTTSTSTSSTSTSTSTTSSSTTTSSSNTTTSTTSTSSGPYISIFKTPDDNMSDSELNIIALYGTSSQKKKANEIISERKYKREDKRLSGENTKIKTEVAEVKAEVKTVTEPVKEKPLKEAKTKDVSIIEEKFQRKKKNVEAAQPANLQEVKNESVSVNSQKGGDPVRLTEGVYEQNEIDLEAGNVLPVQIKRKYLSNYNLTSVFGVGWISNLDERIILGTEAECFEKQANLENYVTSIKNCINSYETELAEAYKVQNIYSAKSEISHRINLLNEQKSKLNETLPAAQILFEASDGYKAHAEIEENLADIQVTLNELEYEIHRYEEILQEIDYHLEQLTNYKSMYASGLQLLKDYEPVAAKTRERKNQNKFAMIKGSPGWYEETGLDSLLFINEDGDLILFKEKAGETGKWISESQNYPVCEAIESGYKIIERNGIVREFDKNGFVIKITDLNQNTISFHRDVNEKVYEIENSFGEKFKIDYAGNLISKITNVRMSNVFVKYYYQENRLTSFKDSEGDVVSMLYDSENHLTDLIKCDNSKIHFEYGEKTAAGDTYVTATVNEEEYEETFIYHPKERYTEYINHDGERYVYNYDENCRTTKECLPDGSFIEYEYDSYGNLLKKNENGYCSYFSYDADGNKTNAAYDDGSTESWEYDEKNQLKTFINREKDNIQYVRDSNGNLIEYKVNGKTALSQTFNERGLVSSKTEYGQIPVKAEYKYDSFGNLIREQIADSVKEYTYDKLNRLHTVKWNNKLIESYKYQPHQTECTRYNGLKTIWLTNGRKDIIEIKQTDTKEDITHDIRIEYDKRHLPVRIYIGDGKSEKIKTIYAYTAEGKIRAEVVCGEESWITLYEYKNGELFTISKFKTEEDLSSDILNDQKLFQLFRAAGVNVNKNKYEKSIYGKNQKQLRVTDTLGTSRLFDFDACGNLINYSDADGTIHLESEYSLNKVTADYYPDGSLKSSRNTDGFETFYNYDDKGQIINVSNKTKNQWYEYDSFGRIIKQITGDSNNETDAIYYVDYEYSEDGHSVTVTEGGKYKTIQQLDAFGNVIQQIDGKGNVQKMLYDCDNNLICFSDGYNNSTEIRYNASGKISQIKYPEGYQAEYTYNFMGLLTQIKDCYGIVYNAVYDGDGRLLKEKARPGSELEYIYDKNGKLNKIISGSQTILEYKYEDNNKRIIVIDGNQNPYEYNYDSLGQLIFERNRNGDTQNYSYDLSGNLKNKVNFAGERTECNYSDDGLIYGVHYFDGSENRFVYNQIGKITEAKNSNETIMYEYDKGGRLIEQRDVNSGEVLSFEYDEAGNRIRLKSSKRDTFFSYGKNNELLDVFDNKLRISISFQYNAYGQEVLRKFGNGTVEKTLYDEAGRVIVKMHKTSGGELIWAEGYVYGSDGKRTATVDNLGRITLYEYDSNGRLETVWYPGTEELIEKIKQDASLNGLPVTGEAMVNRYITSEEKSAIIPLMNAMQYGLAFNLTNLHLFVKEKYEYDSNGNQISKITPYGKIEYIYDKENCVTGSGAHGEIFVNYTYDKNGNLLTETSSKKTKKYAYNAQNRLMYCEVTDKTDCTYCQTSYAYDAFGRRIIVQDNGEAALRSIYDGMTFDVVEQRPAYSNGLFADNGAGGIQWGKAGRPTGGRYRYLSDDEKNDNTRYFYLDENTYKKSDSRYRGERTLVSINGNVLAQSLGQENQYFATDLLGSISTVTDETGGLFNTCKYDVFGSIIKGDFSEAMDFGYLGKQYDSTSSLYNYGYRDYSPQLSRFTTQDPIRDGTNWFAYCGGDPVNFVDYLGLEQTEYQKAITKALAEHVEYDIDLQNYIKENVSIEIIRSEQDNGNNGKYYQSKASVKLGNIILNEIKIQSTADHPKLNNGEKKYEGGTISVGEYTGTLLNKSGSYLNAISITGGSVKTEDHVLVHPDVFTALGDTESYSSIGKPYSLACQITDLNSFNETISILNDLELKGGTPSVNNENEAWCMGDTIKIIIKNK